jgi:hypothetical protein
MRPSSKGRRSRGQSGGCLLGEAVGDALGAEVELPSACGAARDVRVSIWTVERAVADIRLPQRASMTARRAE